MAVKDVKEYYYKLLIQTAEMKADLEDFEKAFKDGYITEDRLDEAKKQVEAIEANFERVGYVMYLLEMPNRPKKAAKWKKQNAKLAQHFQVQKADADAVLDENKSSLDNLRAELKKLGDTAKNK